LALRRHKDGSPYQSRATTSPCLYFRARNRETEYRDIVQGGFRLFRFRGIDVFLHWTWFLVAAYSLSTRKDAYTSLFWNGAEYLAIFLFVLLHEFGHVLACRQTGGQANHILLWPLGGIAYVDPPPRPGAQLWSIAAGPLVNVVLLVLLKGVAMVCRHFGWDVAYPDAFSFMKTLWWINWGLLLFNLLPIFPLDGGQILRSLLWFWVGQARSLWVACVIGFVGAMALGALALWSGMLWTAFIVVFLLWGNWNAFQRAQALLQLGKLPRSDQFTCPLCQAPAFEGNYWKCATCQTDFDLFKNGGICPQCSAMIQGASCVECGKTTPVADWKH
jgi:Zn-dependent protease